MPRGSARARLAKVSSCATVAQGIAALDKHEMDEQMMDVASFYELIENEIRREKDPSFPGDESYCK